MASEGRLLTQQQQEGAPDVRIICRVCQKQWSKYACPRCNVRYCSLPCYKAHSNRCTEGFYKDNAEHELRQRKADPEERRKILHTLKRMQEAGETEDLEALEGGTDLAEEEGGEESDMEVEEEGGFEMSEETLRRLSEKGSDLSLDDLTSTERAALRKAAASGALSRFIAPWEPWYLSPEAKHIRISPTGTRPVREVSRPGGSFASLTKTPAQQAFEKLMGGQESAANIRRRGNVNPSAEPLEGSGSSIEVRSGGDVSGVSETVRLGAADVSGEGVTSAVRQGAPSAGPASDAPPDDSTFAPNVSMDAPDVSMDAADVTEGRADVSDDDAGPGIPPPPDEDLPPLETLAKHPPSPLLGFHLTSVLYAYCYVMRLFNGEWAGDPSDAAETLVTASPVLSDGATPASVQDAIHGCLERACSPSLAKPGGRAFAKGLVGDVNALLALGRPGVVCALADVQRMLSAAQEESQKEGAEAAKAAKGLAGNSGTHGSRERSQKGIEEGAGSGSFSGEMSDLRRGVVLPAENEGAPSDKKGTPEGGVIRGGRKAVRGGAAEKGRKASRRPELVRRKVFFFLVWANEQTDPVFHALAAAVSECWEDEKRFLNIERGKEQRQQPGVIQEL